MCRVTLILVLLAAALPAAAVESAGGECVFVLHGYGRSWRSMTRIADRLSDAGFVVDNRSYPSRRETFPQLVARLAARVEERKPACTVRHFVGYSLGALIVRDYLGQDDGLPGLGRVVLIGPPNHGSELVDLLGGGGWLFRKFLGPVAPLLGTSRDSIPSRLGPAHYPLGIIAGDRMISPLGFFFLPRPHDGTVSVASARLEGMTDFLLVHRSHSFMIGSREVADQTTAFLRRGRFGRDATS